MVNKVFGGMKMQPSYNIHSQGDFAVIDDEARLASIADLVRPTMNIDPAVQAYQQGRVGTIYANSQNHAGVIIGNISTGKAHVAFTFADEQGHKMLVQMAKALGVTPPQLPEPKPH